MEHSSSRVIFVVLGIAGSICCGNGGTGGASISPTAPAVITEASAPAPSSTVLPYGQATGSAVPCPAGSSPSTTCTNLVVTCPSVPAASATLRRWAEPGTADRGTMLLTTGGDGALFTTQVSTLATSMIATFTADGLSVVELAWQPPGIWGGPRARTLACRYATAAKWVNENLHTGGRGALFAAQGTSGGASQIAFGLAHYGIADFLELANLGGGPPGCPLCAPDGVNAREPLLPGAPPLSNHDPVVNYPATTVRFFLGDQEPTPAQAGVDAFTAAVHAALK